MCARTFAFPFPAEETEGGTGQYTYIKGDILYASAADTLSKLGIGATGQLLKTSASGIPAWETDATTGDVTGPGSATNNAIVRFDETTGKLIQDSLVTIDDTGSINIPTGQTYNINGTALAYTDITGAAASGANADITSMTALTQITRATGGAFDIAIGSAVGDDFTIDTNKLVVSGDTGDIGIGTATPSVKLHIHNTTAATYQYITTDDIKDTGIFLGNDFDGTANYSGMVFDQSDDVLKIFNSNSVSNHLVVDNTGSVGIGVVIPGAKLTIYDPLKNALADVGDKTNYHLLLSGSSNNNEAMGSLAFGRSSDIGASIIAKDVGAGNIADLLFYTKSDVTVGADPALRMTIRSAGNIGIGTSTPDTLLQLKNNEWLSFVDYAGTGALNTLKGNEDDEIEVGTTLKLASSIEFEEDSGVVTAMDMPVSVSSADGLEMSYTFKIDGNNVLKVYAEADGSGGADSFAVKLLNSAGLDITQTAGVADYDKFLVSDSGRVKYRTGAEVLSDIGAAATNQTMYIGTTAVAINRTTAALTLAGITLTTPDIGTPSAGTLTNCSFPTLNQNTTGTASNVSGTPALPNGTTATTQAGSDNSTKLATTAYADTAAAAGGATAALDNLASVAINTTLVSDTDNTDALGTTAIAWSDLFLGNESIITWNTAPSTADVTLTHAANILTFAGGTIALGTATATGGLTGNVTGDCTGSSGSCTGESATVANATLTTALTVNTGTLTLTANAANNSVLTIGAGAVSISGTNTGDNTVCTSGTATTAATLATTRAIYGNNFNGSAALTQVIGSAYGGTGNGFTKFTGATTAEKTYTLPDSSVTLLYNGGALGTPSGGTLTSCTGLPAAAVVAGSLVSGMIASDHGTAATDQIINVSYGTSETPPTASTTTEGSLYIQYTA